MRKSAWHLEGKSVLITGAANGIGAATARLLLARKTRLSLVDIQGSALRQLTLDLGVEAICHEVDAGVVTVAAVERGDPQAFEQVISVNLLGAWQTIRAVLPQVIAAQGYILFVSSLAGTIQGPSARCV